MTRRADDSDACPRMRPPSKTQGNGAPGRACWEGRRGKFPSPRGSLRGFPTHPASASLAPRARWGASWVSVGESEHRRRLGSARGRTGVAAGFWRSVHASWTRTHGTEKPRARRDGTDGMPTPRDIRGSCTWTGLARSLGEGCPLEALGDLEGKAELQPLSLCG